MKKDAITAIFLIISFLMPPLLSPSDALAQENRTVVRVGSEFEFRPFAFVDEHGQAAGFSVDLIKAVARVMGLDLEIRTAPWDELWNDLVYGRMDILPIVARQQSRIGLIDFSLPHTETYDAFFVRDGDNPIPNLAAASGKSIVTMRSDASHHALLDKDFKGDVVLVDTIPEGLALVASGKHGAYLGPILICTLAIEKHNIKGLKAGKPIPDYKRVFSFGVKKDDEELLEKLNQGLLIVKTSGEYDRIYAKWLKISDPWSEYTQYLLIAVGAAVVIIVIACVALFILRRMVRMRVAELARANKMLEEEIAERNSAQRRLLEYQEELETLVEKRTESLNLEILEHRKARESLASAKRAAEAANKAKSEFLANMSHEIRTPLNGIIGMLQLLLFSEINEEQKEVITAAVSSSHRLANLLTDILDLSRMEADRLSIMKADFRMPAVKNSILELLSPAVREKGIRLEFSIDDEVPQVMFGDETRLRQVIFNLVGNAVKFTAKGEVKVSVHMLSRPEKTPYRILFLIEDTGIGIDDDTLEIIFEPFTQAEGSYIRQYQGAGLGLALVSRIVKLMNGELCIDSDSGRGTSAYLVLPFGPSTDTLLEMNEIRRTEKPNQPNPLRILLVEDEAVNRLTTARMLDKLGHGVICAVDGQEALRFVFEEKFDLIFMDIRLPETDGVRVTRTIRSDTSGRIDPNIPIIALTAYTLPGDREKFLAAGMNDYLAKPVLIEDLRRVLEKHSGRAQL